MSAFFLDRGVPRPKEAVSQKEASLFWKGAGTVVSPTLVGGRMVPDPWPPPKAEI